MAEYRRFTKTDWDAFAGAEAFTGSDPFIYEKTMNAGRVELAVVIDRNGVQINLLSDDDKDPVVYMKEQEFKSIVAEGELRALIKVIDLYDYAPDLTYELNHPTHEATKGYKEF